MEEAFALVANRTAGPVLGCIDDPGVQRLAQRAPVISYGLDPAARWQVTDLDHGVGEISFVLRGPQTVTAVQVPRPGVHIALDAAGAVGFLAELGYDPQAAAAGIAEDLNSYCLLVFRGGTLVYERYWQGHDETTPQVSWSIAKSHSATLVGIAIDNGHIESLDQPVSDFIIDWQGTDKESITVRHIVSMTSGLHWSALDDYVSMATFAANRLQPMLANVADIIAIEMLAAAQGIEFHRPQKSSPPLEGAIARLRKLSPPYADDRPLAADIEEVARLILTGGFTEPLESLLPSYTS